MYLAPSNAHDDVARLRALFLRLPPEAVACRQTAARLHGFGEFAPLSPQVHILVPAGLARPQVRGVKIYDTVRPVEPVMVHGIPCVPAARCAVDLARTSRRLDALPVLDGALRLGGCTTDDLAAEVALHQRLRGVCQVRELVSLADPGAQCRQESQMRLVIIDGQLPRPELQVAVVDEYGNVRYYLDLGWRRRRVGAEYDGVSHLDRVVARRDRERHNWLVAQGWRMRYFTDVDLYRRPQHLVTVLRGALT
ncbi:endonuclease domain-containing protein [Phytohabitans rumicis]|uniref:endonuclease domain-containing protein n=1 Tax=Phytohabitans rumicis TaxID=1076125 RepID=UPI001FE38471|nr:endonuclease domain-containing protein [Phytohabitans rumicis]